MPKVEFIVVSDVINDKNDVIVAGVNKAYDNLPVNEIKRRIGNSVVISGKTYKVMGVEASRSLTGQKNIFIKLANALNDARILKGKVLHAD